jgi:hypothetical protein
MEKPAIADLPLGEAIDLIGKNIFSGDWNGISAATFAARQKIDSKLREVIASGQVGCWYDDGDGNHVEVSPLKASHPTFVIALHNNAFGLGKNGELWFRGFFWREQFVGYIEGRQIQSASEKLEVQIKAVLDAPPPHFNKDICFQLVIEHYKSRGQPNVPRHQFDLAWDVVIAHAPYQQFGKPGRRKGT